MSKVNSIENVYRAYLRAKNSSYRESKFDDIEICYFESELDNMLSSIAKELEDFKKFNLEEFRIYYKFKKLDYLRFDQAQEDGNLRPLARYTFKDEVKIQAVFNVLIDRLSFLLPTYNYGVRVDDPESAYAYKPWYREYRTFMKRTRDSAKYSSKFQYLYTFDLDNFYPSIDQQTLIEDIRKQLETDDEDSVLFELVKRIIEHFGFNNCINISDIKSVEKNNKPKIVGLPQGLDSSIFLSVFYIRDLKNEFIKSYNKIISRESQYRKISEDSIDFIMYVDDGMIFFRESVNEELVQTALEQSLCIISNLTVESDNQQGLRLNSKKSKFYDLDEKNLRDILNNTRISQNRPRIDENDFMSKEQYLFIQEGVNVNSFEDKKNQKSIVVNETMSRQLKRNISLFSKFRLGKEELMEQINDFIEFDYRIEDQEFKNFHTKPLDLNNDEYYSSIINKYNKIFEKNIEEKEKLERIEKFKSAAPFVPFIDEINFEYVFRMLLEKCNSPRERRAVFNRTFGILNEIKDRHSEKKYGNLGLMYYETVILSELLSYPASEIISEKENLKRLTHELLESGLVNFMEDTTDTPYTFNKTSRYLLYFASDIEWRKNIYSCSLSEILMNEMYLMDSEKNIIRNTYSDQEWMNSYVKPLEAKQLNYKKIYSENYDVIDFERKGNETSKKNAYIINVSNLNISVYQRPVIENLMVLNLSNSTFDLSYDSISDRLYALKITKAILKLWLEKFQKNDLSPSLINPKNIFIYATAENKEDDVPKYEDFVQVIENKEESYYSVSNRIPELYYRDLLKQFFVKVFDLNETDEYVPSNLDFWQIRILMALNSKRFLLDRFLNIAERAVEEDNVFSKMINNDLITAGYTFIDRFYVADAMIYVDKLLVIHHYYTNIWKNGSKDLFFFTLHNQLHAYTLINNYNRIRRNYVRAFSLNQYEEFLLFSACYLHDIAMLLEVDQHQVIDQTNEYVNRFLLNAKELLTSESRREGDIKPIDIYRLLNVHKLVESLLENLVRSTHPERAEEIIKILHKLPLKSLEREIVSVVSKAHGQKSDDVYGVRYNLNDNGKSINVRYLSMWLRLLDLSDVGKERVTEEVLDFFANRMSSMSLSQWIKHLSTDKITIKGSYHSKEEIKEKIDNNSELYDEIDRVDKHAVILNMDINIILNFIPDSEKVVKKWDDHKCYYFEDGKIKRNKQSDHCNVMCNFIREHKFFEDEVNALNLYFLQYENTYITLNYVLAEDYVNKREFVNSFTGQEQRDFEEELLKHYIG